MFAVRILTKPTKGGRMSRRKGGCLTAAAVALSLLVCAVGATLLYLVLTGGVPSSGGGAATGVEPKSFSEYSWSELSEVAQLVAQEGSDEEGRALAQSYGISVGDVRTVPLADGHQATLTVVGIRADERADGSGAAGLTLMLSPIALRPMNAEGTNAGGWEGSDLRAWLAGEGADLLPAELMEAVVPVSKATNNVGVTSEASAVTETVDELWLFSASEVCGEITWFADEYGTEPNYYTGYVDFSVYDALLSLEGEQYEYFASMGVTALSDPNGALALDYGGAETTWWYRSAYPYTFTGEDESYFYQVMSSGYPSSVGLSSESAGVVVGLCL